jgi:hypothetical protein
MADKGGGRWDVGRDWTDDELGRVRPGESARPPERTRPNDPAPPRWSPDAGGATAAGDPRTAEPGPSRAGYSADPYRDPAGYPPRSAQSYPPGAAQRPGTASQPGTGQRAGAPYQPAAPQPPAWQSAPAAGQRSAPAYQRYAVDPAGATHRTPASYETYLDDPADAADAGQTAPVIRPTRVLLLIALAISAGVVFYGFFIERGVLQVPILVVGLAMLGISFLLTALASLRGGIRVARHGSRLASAGLAFFGGLCALGAAGSLASALILANLYQPPG